MKPRNQPEQEIKTAILEWFMYRKDALVWPNDSVGIFDPKRGVFRKKNSRFHINGVPDILGIWKGIPLAIEVKAKRGVVSPDQAAFIEKFTAHGGIAFVAHSVDDVVNTLTRPNDFV